MTIASGLAFLLAMVLRLGFLSRLLSRAVITGFLFGAGIDVVIGELPKLTGTDADGTNSWRELGSWLGGLDGSHRTTVIVGVVSLVVVFGLHRVAPKVPGALVLVGGGLIASRVLDLAAHGVATVGHVPRGLPSPELPAHLIGEHAGVVATAAVALFLIGFSQTTGDARVFAARHGYRIRVDQEMTAQGVSNVGAGVFQGMPVSTSLSASSLNDASGARTSVASLVTGAVVVLTLIVLAPLFSDLPKPVLAAIIIDAVVFGMMDVAEMRRLWRVKRLDFWIAALALVGVLSAGVLAGVVIGICLSIGWLVFVSATPAMSELGRSRTSSAFLPLDPPDVVGPPGILIVRIDGDLTFVTSEALADGVERLLADRDPGDAVILDFVGVNVVDSQGAGELARLIEILEREGRSLRLSKLGAMAAAVLETDGVIGRLGADRVHADLAEAVRAEANGADGTQEG